MVCDAKFSQYDTEMLTQRIIDFRPDIVGITAYTCEINEAGMLADFVKKNLPATQVIVGGPHVSAIPTDCMMEFQAFDIGVIGEGEISLTEICEALINNVELSNIKGIVYRDNENNIVLTDKRDTVNNLDELPPPAWHMLPPAPEYFIQTGRGCPFQCNFCFNSNGNFIRMRSVDSVIAEMLWLIDNVKPLRISFGDEVFGLNRRFTYALLEKMIALGIDKKVNWDVQTHVNVINEELIAKMKLAGVTRIEMGVESGNDEILARMGKSISRKTIADAFSLAKKYKIATGAFLIFGHPEETKRSIWQSIRFVAQLNPTEPVFAIMVPYPGTLVAQWFHNSEMGYIDNRKPWSSYRKQINGIMNLERISNRQLKLYLLIANVWVYLAHFRILGFTRFVFSNIKNIRFFFKHL